MNFKAQTWVKVASQVGGGLGMIVNSLSSTPKKLYWEVMKFDGSKIYHESDLTEISDEVAQDFEDYEDILELMNN